MGVCVFMCLHATLPKHQGILVSTTFSYAQLFNTPDELPKFSQRRLPWGLPWMALSQQAGEQEHIRGNGGAQEAASAPIKMLALA